MQRKVVKSANTYRILSDLWKLLQVAHHHSPWGGGGDPTTRTLNWHLLARVTSNVPRRWTRCNTGRDICIPPSIRSICIILYRKYRCNSSINILIYLNPNVHVINYAIKLYTIFLTIKKIMCWVISAHAWLVQMTMQLPMHSMTIFRQS